MSRINLKLFIEKGIFSGETLRELPIWILPSVTYLLF